MAIAVGVAAASCQKVELTPSENTEGSTFALNASIEQTKTTINGLNVNWEDGDVLYLVTRDGTWGKPYKDDNAGATIAEYTYSAGTFASKATIANGTYTFNALYGSTSQKSYHRGASTTYNLQSTQSQDCSNPTGHLKLNDALVGTFKATVPMADPASVSMSHIFAIMRVDVKNATGADVELKSFEMSAAGATLAGVFTVNFANSPIDITEKTSQSSSIKVNLTNGTVAAGKSLPVYFVMAPLANYSGDVTFTVTDVNDLEYTKTVTLTNISFEAGSLNTTPYTITTGVAPSYYVWDLSIDSTSEATETKIAWTNDVADMVCTQGEGGTAANNYYPGTGQSSTRFYSNSTLSITPKDGKSLTYYVFEATTEGYATVLANSTWTNAEVNVVGTTVTVIAKDPSVAVSAVIGATCGFTKVECHTDEAPLFAPIISATPTSINVPAAGDVCTINYSIDFPVDGKSISATSDQDWVNKFDYSTNGKISFAVDANTGDERTATVTLSYEGADDVTVLVTQAAAGSVSKKTVTYTVTSTSAVSASGDAPSGSSATYSSTYSSKAQLTSGNSMTLTLSGYKGMIVKGLTLSMKSNSKSGAGYLSIKAGSESLGSIGSSSSGVSFNNASWNEAWSTSYVDVKPTLSNTAYTVQTGEDIVIVIGATANSLYCQSFTIEYVADPSFVGGSDPVKLATPSVSCTAQTETSLTFSWDAVANASGYQVSVDGGSTYGDTQDGTSYIWTGLSANTSYTLYVKAIGDNSSYTDSEAATAKGTTTAGSGSGETPGVTTVSLDETEIKALGQIAYTANNTINDGNVTWTVHAYKDNASRPWLQLKKDSNVYVKISAPSAIKEVRLTITSATNSSGGIENISMHDAYSSSGTISLKSADAAGNTTTNDVVSCKGDAISNNNVTLVPTGSNKDLYLKVSTGARIWGIEVDY